jgi:hypothetical protein
MSRGVVLWPDETTSRVITGLWASLEAEGIHTLASRTHGRHRPHVSLVVGEDLSPPDALAVLPFLPRQTLPLVLNSAGVFPGGVLFLACVPLPELLEEQRRVHGLVAPMTTGLWPYCEPGAWTPHVTISYDLCGEELEGALAITLDHLPIAGLLVSGGVEDGSSGDRWPAGEPASVRVTD